MVVADQAHDKILTGAGFERETTTVTQTGNQTSTTTRYCRPVKGNGKKSDGPAAMPQESVCVTHYDDTDETVWSHSLYRENDWLSGQGSRPDTLAESIKTDAGMTSSV